jgi:hypothetical protein
MLKGKHRSVKINKENWHEKSSKLKEALDEIRQEIDSRV